MEVILLEKIANLGNLGDKVQVKPGYGRNYLVPQGKAKLATAANLAEFEAKRVELEKIEAKRLEEAKTRASEFEGKSVSIKHMIGEEGKLFGSVTAYEIAEAVSSSLSVVEKSEIRLTAGPIREEGEHPVQIVIHTDVIAELTVKVEPE